MNKDDITYIENKDYSICVGCKKLIEKQKAYILQFYDTLLNNMLVHNEKCFKKWKKEVINE